MGSKCFHGVSKILSNTSKQYKRKTYDDFCKSSYYNAFVKFGRFMMHINPLYPEKYIDYVILSKIKLDHWARDDLYETYLIETLKIEPVESALQRSIATMMDWAEEQNAQWSDYFRLVNTNRAVQHIQQGKISPWLLLGCKAGKKLLKSFNDEQLQMIAKIYQSRVLDTKNLKVIQQINCLYKKQPRRQKLSKIKIRN